MLDFDALENRIDKFIEQHGHDEYSFIVRNVVRTLNATMGFFDELAEEDVQSFDNLLDSLHTDIYCGMGNCDF